MRETCQLRTPSASSATGRKPGDLETRRARLASDDLDLGEAQPAEPGSERFHRGLLGRKTGGEPGHRVEAGGDEGTFRVGEDALCHFGPASEEPAEALDVDRVDAHPDHQPAPFVGRMARGQRRAFTRL